MRRLRQWLIRLTTSMTGRHDDTRLREEIDDHIAFETDANLRRGLPPAEARRRALLTFGSMAAFKENYRDQQGVPPLEHLLQDVRAALRSLRRSPGFALVAITTLALGIGANTAIFSVINAAFFAPYRVKEPEHLVRLWGQDLKRNILQLGFSVPKYELIRDQQTSFTALGAATQLPQTLLLNGTEPIQVTGALTTSSFLEAFGAAPIAGRFFRADEERGASVAVIGEGIWRARFAATSNMVGQSITVDGVPYTVIGIAPPLPAFWDADIWTTNPFQFPGIPEDTIRRGFSYLQPVARLEPGVSEEQARRELDVLATRYASAYPSNADVAWTLTAIGLRDDIVGASRSSLLTLLGAVGSLLLVACANVANLVLVRPAPATARKSAFASRSAHLVPASSDSCWSRP